MKFTKRSLSAILTLVMLLTALPLSSAMFSVSAQTVDVTGVEFTADIYSLDLNSTHLFTASVLPSNATNKLISYTSSDPSVVGVNEYGAVTGNSTGAATITATTDDGGFTDECTVVVALNICPADSGHKFKRIVTPPTCTQGGYTVYVCHCSEKVVTQIIDALGHEWSRGSVTKFPTCTESGELTFRCTRGDCKVTKTEPMEPLNHVNAYEIEAIASTCTEVGYTGGKYCPDCEAWLTGHDEIEKANHVDEDFDGICDICNTRLKKPEPTIEPAPCSCNCHKTGTVRFFFGFILFFQKIFGLNKICQCGVAHY